MKTGHILLAAMLTACAEVAAQTAKDTICTDSIGKTLYHGKKKN